MAPGRRSRPPRLPVVFRSPVPARSGRASFRGARCLPSAGAFLLAILLACPVLPAWTQLPAVPGASSRAQAQVPATLEVRVLDASDGRPVAGVLVTVEGSGDTGRTDASGVARFRGLEPGRVQLRASGTGWLPLRSEAVVENGSRTRIDIRLHPDPVVLAGLQVRAAPETEALPTAGSIRLRPAEAGASVRTLADLLEEAPGVLVERRGGPGAPSVPSIRGSAGDQVLVLVDGVPLNSALTGEADLSQVDLASVEDVVVIPGAGSSRHGSGALAGTILITTRSAGARDWRANVAAGSLGEESVQLESGSIPGLPGPWRLGVGGEWMQAEGNFRYDRPDVRGGGTAVRGNAGVSRIRGETELVRDGRTTEARIRAHGQRVERGTPGTIVQPSATGTQVQERLGLRARWTGDGGAHLLGWALGGAAEAHEGRFADPDPPLGPAYADRSRVLRLGADAETSLRLPEMGSSALLGRMELAAGVQLASSRIRADGLGPNAPDAIGELALWSDLEGRRAGPGGRGELRWILGGRLDRHDLVSGVAVSPAAQLELVAGGTRGWLRTGRAFSAPSLSDLYFQEGVLARSNPTLEPERVRGEVEAGLGHEQGLAGLLLTAELAAWRADVDGMILWLPDHRFVWRPENFDVRREGASASLALETPSGRLRMRGRLDRQGVEYTGRALSGQVAYRPLHTGTVDARLRMGPVDLDTRVRRIGSRRSQAGSDVNRLDAHTRWSAGLSSSRTLESDPLGRVHLQLDLSVENLLDQTASLLVDYPLPGRTFGVRLALRPGR
ncbi:MAG: TonB-dependent receptor [Gemmatimonadales bacterium]|nr:MAG: TonB-dependent receptor [Gemmatimonadales bacterium]